MKQTHFHLLFLLLTSLLNAQQKQGIVNYGYIKSLESGAKQGDEYNAQLLFDNHRSYFVSEKDSLENNSEIPPEEEIIVQQNETTIINLSGKRLTTTEVGNQVYFDSQKDSIWSHIMLMGGIYVAEKNIQKKWKLEKESKKIANFNCRKATTTFRGRNYTAWYTTDIPVPYGPWKLINLPGLVLEAYDDEFKIYFYFKNLEYPLEKEIKIDQIKPSLEEPFVKWHTYDLYLKHAKKIIEDKYERVMLVAKENNNSFKPIKSKIEEERIEIAE